MKILLITGINGVIGKIIAPHLSKSYEIYGIDSKGPFEKNSYPIDISNFDALASLQDNLPKIDHIIHLAAASQPDAPWDFVLKNNIIGTRNIFELARESAVKKVIFASSTHAFGNLPNWPNIDFSQIPIDTAFAPDSLYGVSKAYGETLARYYFEEHGLNFTMIRIGSINKEDQPAQGYKMIHLYHKDLIRMIEEAIEDSTLFKIIWAISKPNSA